MRALCVAVRRAKARCAVYADATIKASESYVRYAANIIGSRGRRESAQEITHAGKRGTDMNVQQRMPREAARAARLINLIMTRSKTPMRRRRACCAATKRCVQTAAGYTVKRRKCKPMMAADERLRNAMASAMCRLPPYVRWWRHAAAAQAPTARMVFAASATPRLKCAIQSKDKRRQRGQRHRKRR